MSPPVHQIQPVESPEALARLRELLEEYWSAFGFSPCFQNFTRELDGLPGAYAPPTGRLAMAWVQGQPAGCIALRRVNAQTAEVKRLYVRPEFRGRGLGRVLLHWVIAEGRTAGYKEIIGDTMPYMKEALALYDQAGFERVPAQPNQTPDAPIDIRLSL